MMYGAVGGQDGPEMLLDSPNLTKFGTGDLSVLIFASDAVEDRLKTLAR